MSNATKKLFNKHACLLPDSGHKIASLVSTYFKSTCNHWIRLHTMKTSWRSYSASVYLPTILAESLFTINLHLLWEGKPIHQKQVVTSLGQIYCSVQIRTCQLQLQEARHFVPTTFFNSSRWKQRINFKNILFTWSMYRCYVKKRNSEKDIFSPSKVHACFEILFTKKNFFANEHFGVAMNH